jgi:membrane fusion protein, multidrug efflux system
MPDIHVSEQSQAALPRARRPEPTHAAAKPGHPIGHALTILVVLAVSGGVVWWFLNRTHPQPVPPPPMRVPVMIVTPQTVPIYRSFPATTQAMRTVIIQARVTGYLTEQGALDGADVEPGALLYSIDAKDYQSAFAQARASLGQANASVDYSRANNGRNQILAHEGWVSRDAADQSQSNFHQGQQSQASSTAALKEAALNLSRTEIRAPFAGRLSASQVFKGSLISVAGATLNTLVQLDPIYVSFSPADTNLDEITREQARGPIETAVAVNGGKPSHTGPLTFIDNQVSLSTGTILLRATIDNKDHGLLPGQYVSARLHLGDLKGALLVPQNAVVATQIGQTVLIVGKDDKVEQRIVKLGDTEGDKVVVTDGLKPGDRIITGDLQKLKPGAPVQPAGGGPN